MEFYKYPSLTNHYAIKKDKLIMSHIEDEFYSTEKLHGANVSIIFDRDLNHELASRRRFVHSEEDKKQFSGLSAFYDEHQSLLKDIAQFYLDKYPTAEQVHMFGELYGAGIQKMQYEENKQGIKTVRFFTVIINQGEDLPKIKASHDDLLAQFPSEMVVPMRKSGKLIDLIMEDEDDINKSALGGIAEGSVYQLREEYPIIQEHFIGIKHKSEAYTEKKNVSKPKTNYQLTPEEVEVTNEIQSRITSQRLDNVLSHGGLELIDKNIGPIIKEMQTDIINELERETDVDLKLARNVIRLTAKDIVTIIKQKMMEM